MNQQIANGMRNSVEYNTREAPLLDYSEAQSIYKGTETDYVAKGPKITMEKSEKCNETFFDEEYRTLWSSNKHKKSSSIHSNVMRFAPGS
jgi:hypothetical protein